MKPKLLDLYCGAGGAAMGYARAGFDVTGVDIVPQKRYPFAFILGDALEYVAAHGHEYDVIHASPPCQAYIRSGMVAKDGRHPDLLGRTRDALRLQQGHDGVAGQNQAHADGDGCSVCGKRAGDRTHAAHRSTDLPALRRQHWIIENVPGAPMVAHALLCGTMFGLRVRRHRWFETSLNVAFMAPASCNHSVPITGVYGHPHGKGGAWRNGKRPMLPSDKATWSREMGIDWMSALELAAAIPPAYSTGRAILRCWAGTTDEPRA